MRRDVRDAGDELVGRRHGWWGLFDCSFFPSLIAQMCPPAAEWAAHAPWARSLLRCRDWWGWEMSVSWSAVTGWRLCGAGLLKVHCTQRWACEPPSLQQAKWTFLESLGLFNTPLGLTVTLLVLSGWRWQRRFHYESGFRLRARTEMAKLGGSSSLERNGVGRLPLKLAADRKATVFSLHLACLSLWLFQSNMNLTSALASGTKQISLVWPPFWEFWPPAESFSLLLPMAVLQQALKWQISHTALCFCSQKKTLLLDSRY